MSPKRVSLYIKAEGPDKAAIHKGINWLRELANEDAAKRFALASGPRNTRITSERSLPISKQERDCGEGRSASVTQLNF